MYLTNLTVSRQVAWSVTDKNDDQVAAGNIGFDQYLDVTVGGTPPYAVNFNANNGSATATVTGITSPDASAIFLSASSPDGEATVTYPWSPSQGK
jgi:hypothetical protein